MMKRLLPIVLALALVISLAAVFAQGETAEETTAASVPDTLLVTVNGKEIRENNEDLQYYYQGLLSSMENPESEEAQVYARMTAMQYVMQSIVVDDKLHEAYSDEEMDAIRTQAKSEWDNIVVNLMTNYYGITEESSEEDRIAARGDVLSMLEVYYGYTEETYMESAVNSAFTEKVVGDLKAADPTLAATDEEVQNTLNDLIAQEKEEVAAYAYFQKLQKEDPEAAENMPFDNIYQILSEMPEDEFEVFANDIDLYEQITAYYDQQEDYSFHYIPEGYRGVIHILLDVDQELLENYNGLTARLEESSSEDGEPVTEEMVEAARQAVLESKKDTIEEIMNRLANGATFEELITEYGIDPGMQVEENLKKGYAVHKDSTSWYPVFRDAAMSLEKVGDVSEPVVSSKGIHIVYYLRDIPGGVLEMSEEELEQLKASIESERVNLALSELVDKWVEEADVTWTPEGEAWKFDESILESFGQDVEETPETTDAAETEGAE